MKVSLVYTYQQNNTPRVDSVYLLRHSARARASKLRAEGKDAFIVRRTLRTKAGVMFTNDGQ
jgi:hypothetical protein